MAEVKPFGTELGTVADDYNYGGMSADEITGVGGSDITLDTILKKPDAMGSMEKSDGGFGGVGTTIQGIAAVAQAAAGFYDAHNRKNYQDKVFKMEEDRVARATQRQDKRQANYDKVFG